MITRAGALDQGNIILNLEDVERRGIAEQTSCSWPARRSTRSRTPEGEADPRLGLEAMLQALEVHRSGALARRADGELPRRPRRWPAGSTWRSAEALRQRYPALAGL